MSRYCIVTQRGLLRGNKVSHANNKTKRVFLPNLQNVSIHSDILDQTFKMRLSMRGLRTVEFHGGIDQFLLTTRNSKLSPELLQLKKKVQKKHECQSQQK